MSVLQLEWLPMSINQKSITTNAARASSYEQQGHEFSPQRKRLPDAIKSTTTTLSESDNEFMNEIGITAPCFTRL